MVFCVFDFLQKMNGRIRLYYYDTSSWLVFIRFFWKRRHKKKLIRSYLTFSKYVNIYNFGPTAWYVHPQYWIKVKSSKWQKMKGVEKILSVLKFRKGLRRRKDVRREYILPISLLCITYFVSITLFIFPGRLCILNIE